MADFIATGITGSAEPRDPVYAKTSGTPAEVHVVGVAPAVFGAARITLNVGTPKRGLLVSVNIPITALADMLAHGAHRLEAVNRRYADAEEMRRAEARLNAIMMESKP